MVEKILQIEISKKKKNENNIRSNVNGQPPLSVTNCFVADATAADDEGCCGEQANFL